jgi:hypothetical protein
MWYTRSLYISFFFINWTLRMSDNLPERVQILGHAHILCITVRENRIICCQIFCDLLLKSAFEQVFNVMQLILVKIKWRIKWKYLIQKFHDICLSYYFNLYKHKRYFSTLSWRNIVTHMGNWRRICFSHYLTRTLFQNPSILPISQHAGKGTRHFNTLEDYRFFHHWFSGVKMP